MLAHIIYAECRQLTFVQKQAESSQKAQTEGRQLVLTCNKWRDARMYIHM